MELSPIVNIIKCPHCGGLHADEEGAYRPSTPGMTLWTDGVYLCPTSFRKSFPFIWCGYGRCEKTFWRHGADIVHTINDRNPYAERSEQEQKVYDIWLELGKSVTHDQVSHCYQAIEEGVAGESRENWKSLRCVTWEESLEAFRGICDLKFPLGTRCRQSTRLKDNMIELRKLLDISEEDDRITALEIHRQLGDFEAALELSEFGWSAINNELIDYQKKLIKHKDTLLRIVPLENMRHFNPDFY